MSGETGLQVSGKEELTVSRVVDEGKYLSSLGKIDSKFV